MLLLKESVLNLKEKKQHNTKLKLPSRTKIIL